MKDVYWANFELLKRKLKKALDNQKNVYAPGLQNQYYENDYINHGNLHSQCNPHQNPKTFLIGWKNQFQASHGSIRDDRKENQS